MVLFCFCFFVEEKKSKKKGGFAGKRTGSAPVLFRKAIQRGNRCASSLATASEDSTAIWRGVSKSPFRLMPSASWPTSMRNSYTPHQDSVSLNSSIIKQS